MNPLLMHGAVHIDSRGKFAFVRHEYSAKILSHYTPDTTVVRAWQGHRKESKWFYVSAGSFLVRLVKFDSWEVPSLDLGHSEFILSAMESQILFIPGGYANGFQAA